VHLVGSTTEIQYDVRRYERQTVVLYLLDGITETILVTAECKQHSFSIACKYFKLQKRVCILFK